MELEFWGVWSAPIKALSATFTRGLHVVLGAPADGTSELIALAAGSRLPRRGSLTLAGTPLFASPALRRRTASVLADEAPGGARAVADWCRDLGALKGFDATSSVAKYCPRIGPERVIASLALSERRELALAVALGQPAPALVALHEPLACLSPDSQSQALERLHELARESIVLCTTSAVAGARRLGGNLHVLERGVLARSPGDAWPDAVTPGLASELWIDCRAPRQLLRELVASPDVTRASFEGDRLRVAGPSLERLCRAVALAAVSSGAGIRALAAGSPDVAHVHAATLGLASAAYRAAQERATSGVIRAQPAAPSGDSGATPPASGSDVT